MEETLRKYRSTHKKTRKLKRKYQTSRNFLIFFIIGLVIWGILTLLLPIIAPVFGIIVMGLLIILTLGILLLNPSFAAFFTNTDAHLQDIITITRVVCLVFLGLQIIGILLSILGMYRNKRKYTKTALAEKPDLLLKNNSTNSNKTID